MITRGEHLQCCNEHLLAARWAAHRPVRGRGSQSCAIEALTRLRAAAAGMNQAGVRPIAFSCPAPDC